MALSAELKRFMDSLACCTYNGAQHSDVLVEETDVLAKLRKVRLQVGGGDWFSFCPDKGRDEKSRMSALLTADKGHDHHRHPIAPAAQVDLDDHVARRARAALGKGHARQPRRHRRGRRQHAGRLHESAPRDLQVLAARVTIRCAQMGHG